MKFVQDLDQLQRKPKKAIKRNQLEKFSITLGNLASTRYSCLLQYYNQEWYER
jgi:hypothetical protein